MSHTNILYIQYWDIIREKEDEYVDFILNEYNPLIKEMGVKIVGGYYVEVGDGPQTIACFSFNDISKVNSFVVSDKFIKITNKLMNFVKNRKAALSVSTGRVSKGEYSLQENVWKWNFYYNVKANKKQDYVKFIEKTKDVFAKIDFVELTEEWRVLFGGKSDYILELTFKDPYDIGRLMNTAEFREIEKTVKKELINFQGSRILRVTERFEKPRWLKL